jgi:hypothetical protein
VVSGNQDRSYGFSVRCIQAQGATVFADPVADPDRFDVFVTGGVLDGKAGPISVGIANARETHKGESINLKERREIEAQLKLIKTTQTAYLVISDVPKKIAKDIKAELVRRGRFVTSTSVTSPLIIKIKRFSPPPLPLPLPAISFKGLTYKQVVSPYTKKVWLDRNLGAEKVAADGGYYKLHTFFV